MARKKREVEVIHIFKDGTVSRDPTVKLVPEEIVRAIHAIYLQSQERIAREKAMKEGSDAGDYTAEGF